MKSNSPSALFLQRFRTLADRKICCHFVAVATFERCFDSKHRQLNLSDKLHHEPPWPQASAKVGHFFCNAKLNMKFPFSAVVRQTMHPDFGKHFELQKNWKVLVKKWSLFGLNDRIIFDGWTRFIEPDLTDLLGIVWYSSLCNSKRDHGLFSMMNKLPIVTFPIVSDYNPTLAAHGQESSRLAKKAPTLN